MFKNRFYVGMNVEVTFLGGREEGGWATGPIQEVGEEYLVLEVESSDPKSDAIMVVIPYNAIMYAVIIND